MRWTRLSVSVWDTNVWPRPSSFSRRLAKFSMIPLCARAILPVQSRWGCALTFDGAPCVAHRVWANPVEPSREGSCASRFAMNPLSFTTWRLLPTIATPALSYPRYSRRFRPSKRIGRAFRRPAYPTIPHIYRTTAPAGIEPRSLAPDSTRARSFTTVPGATLTPLAISTSSPMSPPTCGTEGHSPSICTSPGPDAARRPARAETPDPRTESCTTLVGPRITSSMRMEFETVVRAPIRTPFPRLVDGSRTEFGPISQPAPIARGPCRYAPERITHPSPIDTGPRIVTAGSIVPARTCGTSFNAAALRRRRSHG